MSSSTTESVRPKALIRRAGGDALLGAACGALYGAVFGGFGHLVHGRTWQLFSNAAICALVGLTLAVLASAWQRSRENAGAPSTGSLREEAAERGRS